MYVFAAVFLDVADQLVVVPVVGEALDHVQVKHIRQAGVPDRKDLLPDGFSHEPFFPFLLLLFT